MRRLSRERRAAILALLVEGMSLRSVTRITGASINTVTKLLVDAGEACLAYHDRAVRRLGTKRVQVDEIWSFTYAKQRTLDYALRAPEGAGDTWTWMALDADAKLFISWVVGSRSHAAAHQLMQDLASRLVRRVQLTSDGLSLYLPAVENAFGADVDFAQLVKHYGHDEPESERRYSPPRVLRTSPRSVTGQPDEAHVSTSYVERANLTTRMSVRRFTRLTNAFSKKLANHAHHVALYAVWYNFCRIHKTLRVTPAMEAGAAGELRDLDWIVELIEINTPAPGPRGPYRRRGQDSEAGADSE